MNFRPLKAEEIEVRVGTCSENGASLLLYKDARCDMNLLDETVGSENWMCSYDSIDGKLFCTVSIWSEKHQMWISKQDVGTPSNMEADKGESSDALKRACFRWGLGRELYTAPFIWIPADSLAKHRQNNNGKWQCFDRFSVERIEVVNGRITALDIYDENKRATVYSTERHFTDEPQTVPSVVQQAPQGRFARLNQLKADALAIGIDEQTIKAWIAKTFPSTPMPSMSDLQITMVERYVEGLISIKRSE